MELTEKVLAYQKGYWTWTDLWKDLFLTMDRFLQDRCIDLELGTQVIGALTPRLHSMVGNFVYQGKKFEAFLFTALKYQLKTAYIERRKLREIENSWQNYCAEPLEFMPIDEEPEFTYQGKPGNQGRKQGSLSQKGLFAALGTEQKRILIIALKNCAVLSDRHCQILSKQLGLEFVWLLNCRDELCDLTRARFDNYRNLRARERAMVFALQCADASQTESCRKKQRLEIIRRNLERMNPYPRHQDIAKILGIPKGTIDSSLFYARRQLSQLAKPD